MATNAASWMPLVGLLAGQQSQQAEPEQRGLYARLYDRFNPSSGLADQDKDAIFRQGLLGLAAGMAQTGGQGFGGALGNGLQSGLLAMNRGRENLVDEQYKRQLMAQQTGDPAGFRTADKLARAAGYQPGTEEYRQFMRVAGGVEGRASSAGTDFTTFTDADGQQRPQRNNPRTGGVEIWYDEQQRWVPLGEGSTAGAAAPASTVFTTSEGTRFDVSQVQDPVLKAQIMANPQVYGLIAETNGTVQLPNQAVGTFAPAPIPGLGRGRRKEDEAAAVAAAQRRVELGALPEELGMRTDAAVEQAGRSATAVETAKNQAELARQDAVKGRDGLTVLGLLDEAEKLLPQATGSYAGAIYDRALGAVGKSTGGAQATAALKTIAGQLTSKMPRMEGSQSNIDVQLYREMAGQLSDDTLPVQTRMAALQQIRALNQKYASSASPAASREPNTARLRYNPATGRLE